VAINRSDDVRLMGAVAPGGQGQAYKAQRETAGEPIEAVKWGGDDMAGCSRRNFWHSISFERWPRGRTRLAGSEVVARRLTKLIVSSLRHPRGDGTAIEDAQAMHFANGHSHYREGGGA
jgi:hypothetical protein